MKNNTVNKLLNFILKVFLFGAFANTGQFLKCQKYPDYQVTISKENTAGFYFFTATDIAIKSPNKFLYQSILDEKGDLVYYKVFQYASKCTDFKLQNNGQITFYHRDKFFIMNQQFEIIDSVSCKNNVSTDHHDLQILKNGNFLLLGIEEKVVNLAAHKIFKPNNCAGSTAATVQCGVIQELDKNKNVVFEWRSKNHYKFRDMDTAYIRDPKKVDWTHFNGVAESNDGNILVSARYFNEVTKINKKDGSIIWRLGGQKNEFKFINDSTRFVGQHDIRQLTSGNITLFDNGMPSHPIHPSTAKEYQINEKNRTVELVWQFVNDSSVHSRVGLGNVQRLQNANTLVNYGNSNSETMFNVVKPNGEKVFEIYFEDTLKTYRAFFYDEKDLQLDRPRIKTFRKGNELYLEAEHFDTSYIWSNGEKTPAIKITKPGKYWLIRRINKDAFLYSVHFLFAE